MICEPCRAAGKTLTEVTGAGRSLTQRTHRMVEELHQECPGGTWCACQHSTDSISRETSGRA